MIPALYQPAPPLIPHTACPACMSRCVCLWRVHRLARAHGQHEAVHGCSLGRLKSSKANLACHIAQHWYFMIHFISRQQCMRRLAFDARSCEKRRRTHSKRWSDGGKRPFRRMKLCNKHAGERRDLLDVEHQRKRPRLRISNSPSKLTADTKVRTALSQC